MGEETSEATITIDVKVEGRDAKIMLTSRPMVPALNIAELLEKIAAEIRAGRLDSMRVRDIGSG